MKSMLIAFFFLPFLVTAQTPVIPGTYTVVNPPKEVIVTTVSLRDDGNAVLKSRSGSESQYTWRVERNLLFLDSVGYYMEWSQRDGVWTLKLTPASDATSIVRLRKQ